VTLATTVDVLLATAWLAVVADNLRQERREAAARARLGPVARGRTQAPQAVRLGLLVVLVAGAALLEQRSGGRLAFHAGAAVAGVALALAGVALHARARRALGVLWSSAVAVRTGHAVVRRGPYAVVRHPLYLAVLLLAAGTVLAHPSLATLCVAAGLGAGMALKIPAEERALRDACGDEWTRYAAAVPALLPRPSRLRAALTGRVSR